MQFILPDFLNNSTLMPVFLFYVDKINF